MKCAQFVGWAAAAASVFVATSALAQTPVTFEQAVEGADERARLEVDEATVREAEAGARAVFRGAWFPVIGAEATALWRSEEIAIETPIGDFVQLPGDELTAGVEVRQPLLRPGAWFFDAPAADLQAEAARAQKARTRAELRAEAAGAYFTVLEVEARLVAVSELVESLDAQRSRVQALVDVNRVTNDDLLRIEVALDQAKLGQRELARSLEVAQKALAFTMGQDSPVTAAGLPKVVKSNDEGWQDRREDLRALSELAESSRSQKSGVYWSLVPTIEAFGRGVYTSQEGLNSNAWLEAGVMAKWTPFEAGTRTARADVLEAQAVRAEAQRREAEHAIAVQLAELAARQETASDRLEVETRSVQQAAEALRILKERYDAGSAILPELLDAESQLAERTAARALAEIAIARVGVERALASGRL